MKILLLTKTSKDCEEIINFVKQTISNNDTLKVFKGEFGDTCPDFGDIENSNIISFLSPWIISEKIISQSKIAINFHPAPPKYPGIGCYNFAIYNQDKEFGVTCHHMISKVDSGKIIKVNRFSMNNKDSVLELKNRTMKHLTSLFHEIFTLVITNKELPESSENWLRKPYTRKDLQELCEITPEMTKKERKLRIKATYFAGAKDLPFMKINGEKILLQE